MPKPWYDTVEGIQGSLGSLESLLRLVLERHEAGYKRNERMGDFFVLGRYSLDSVGNCGRIEEWIPKEKFPAIPDVLTREEFWVYIKVNVADSDDVRVSVPMGDSLPHDGVFCPVCKRGWTIENCFDTAVDGGYKTLSLAEFVGKTLGEVKAAYAKRKDAIYRMQDEILIRSDRFIDRSLKYPDTEKDYQKEIVKNESGWLGKDGGITDDYIIQDGDEGSFHVWTYFHKQCKKLHLAFSEEEKFRDIFKKAGFTHAVLHHLPNQYCPCEKCAPWFRVDTEIGTITIGWRKRVINIDWEAVPRKGIDILPLFKGEQTTKEETYIHAWGVEKSVEYLSKIRAALFA